MYIYIGITVLTALFGIIYEVYSHNVFSAHMAFAWPWLLGFGVGVYALLAFLPIDIVPGTLPSSIYNFGVGMITARSIFLGVIEIYGNPGVANTHIIHAYFFIALIFLIIGGLSYALIIVHAFRNKNKEQE